MGLELPIELGIDDARLHHRKLVIDRHLEQTIHAQRREHDLASPGDRSPGEPGAGTTRHDGRARLGRDAHRGLHVVDRARGHHRQWGRWCRVSRLVVSRSIQHVGVNGDDVTESLREKLNDIGHGSTLESSAMSESR